MPMLGDILSSARRSAADVEQWLKVSDHHLYARVTDAAAVEGANVSAFVRMAVADFGRFATEEDWATLVGRLRDSGAPGTTCLMAMLKWRLALVDTTTGSALPQSKELGHA